MQRSGYVNAPEPLEDSFDGLPAPPPLPAAEVHFPAFAESATSSARFFDERQSTYRFYNLGATLESGEPTLGGKMHATGWAHIRSPRAARLVIQTFDSAIDTVLAAYTGPRIPNLHLVTANDDRVVPSVSAKQSLIQLQAAKNTLYNIQFGGRTTATGDILLNISALPPTGGLSAFRTHINGFRAPIGDYVCGYRGYLFNACGRPRFVLFNSTSKQMTVTSSSDLGPGVVAPAPVTLAPGGIKTVEFAINSQFDNTTVRTVAGHFIFTGRNGATVVGRARHRALILVKSSTTAPDVLQVGIKPRVRSGELDQPLPFRVYVGNAGSEDAVGCSFHTLPNQPVKVAWQEINPTNGAFIGTPNLPRTIQSKRSRTFLVLVAAQQARVADATFVGSNQPFAIECANTAPATITMRTAFDVTARALYHPMHLWAGTVSPKTPVVDVPAAGAKLRLKVQNLSAAGSISAFPAYVYPFDDAANKRFTVQVCQTQTATSGCLQPPDIAVEFPIPANAVRYVMVFIKRPAVDPGYDPENRRVVVRFVQTPGSGSGDESGTVAARSVAVRRK